MRKPTDLIAICEKDGEESIKKQLIERTRFSHDECSVVEEWLRRKEEERALDSSSKRDAREEETLSIAREANRIASNALSEAKRANRSRWKDRAMTIIAIIIAAIAARADIMWLISALIKKISP
uniref:Uncharacterized protein n=1 Tax=viral metagenome TaxID=1070528 RepID=A0A6M3LWQ4_9ZZZZ